IAGEFPNARERDGGREDQPTRSASTDGPRRSGRDRNREVENSGSSNRTESDRPRGDREGDVASRPASDGPPGRRGRFNRFAGRILGFAAAQGAALVIDPSSRGDGGTVFVQQASVPAAL